MASHYKVFIDFNGKEEKIVFWLDYDGLSVKDDRVIESISGKLRELTGKSSLPYYNAPNRMIECNSSGETMIYDDYIIEDINGMSYGQIRKGFGPVHWYYFSPNALSAESDGVAIINDTFQIFGDQRYKSQCITPNLPGEASVNWDKLEVKVGDSTLVLTPFDPNPPKGI